MIANVVELDRNMLLCRYRLRQLNAFQSDFALRYLADIHDFSYVSARFANARDRANTPGLTSPSKRTVDF